MKSEFDTVQFESRHEVLAIVEALEEWQESHNNDEKNEYVQLLANILDAMYMSW